MTSNEDMEVLWLNDYDSRPVVMELECEGCGNISKRRCDRPGNGVIDKGLNGFFVMSTCSECGHNMARMRNYKKNIGMLSKECNGSL